MIELEAVGAFVALLLLLIVALNLWNSWRSRHASRSAAFWKRK